MNFIACPSCSRQEFDVIRVMMDLEKRLEDIREPMDVSVIGCKVNGPGEAKESDIGVVGASPNSLVYKNGEKSHLIDTTNESSCYLIEEDFWEEDLLLEKYYKKISKQEFYPITQDAENWPLLDNPADFMIYFNVQFGTFVYDLLVKDLLRETI